MWSQGRGLWGGWTLASSNILFEPPTSFVPTQGLPLGSHRGPGRDSSSQTDLCFGCLPCAEQMKSAVFSPNPSSRGCVLHVTLANPTRCLHLAMGAGDRKGFTLYSVLHPREMESEKVASLPVVTPVVSCRSGTGHQLSCRQPALNVADNMDITCACTPFISYKRQSISIAVRGRLCEGERAHTQRLSWSPTCTN